MLDRIVRYVRRCVFTRVNGTIFITTAIVASIAGPFGTHSAMDFGTRAAFWTTAIAVSFLLAYVVRPLILQAWPFGESLSLEVFACFVFSLAFSNVLWVLVNAFAEDMPYAYRGIWPVLFGWTLLTTGCVAVLRYTLLYAITEPQEAAPKPRLTRRLPEGASGHILRLEARGHYTQVITDDGAYSLRLRLADAIDEMEGVPGLSVHRSHWVSLEAMNSAYRTEKGRLALRCPTGTDITVSRSLEAEVEAAFRTKGIAIFDQLEPVS